MEPWLMLREAVAGPGPGHRCFNVLISMPGRLPPLCMSTPPAPSFFPLFLPELFLKELGKASVCVEAPRGQVPPAPAPPAPRWSDGREIFVKQQCCSAT